jgi:hypothetical protein
MSFQIVFNQGKYALIDVYGECPDERRFVGHFRTRYEAEFEANLLNAGGNVDELRKSLDRLDRAPHVPKRNRYQRILRNEVI